MGLKSTFSPHNEKLKPYIKRFPDVWFFLCHDKCRTLHIIKRKMFGKIIDIPIGL